MMAEGCTRPDCTLVLTDREAHFLRYALGAAGKPGNGAGFEHDRETVLAKVRALIEHDEGPEWDES